MNSPPEPPPRQGLRKAIRALLGSLAVLIIFAVVVVAVLAQGVQAPDWLRRQIESRINNSVETGQLRLGSIGLGLFTSGLNAEVELRDIDFLDPDGQPLISIPSVRSELSGESLVLAKIRPVSLVVDQANLTMRRDSRGRFDISLGSLDQPGKTDGTNGTTDLFAAVEAVFAQPFLSKLQRIESTSTTLTISDEISGRDWQFLDGAIVVENSAQALSGTLTFALQTSGQAPARAVLSLNRPKTGGNIEFTTGFSGFSTREIATQIDSLAWLKVLDAPLNGSLAMEIQPDGKLGAMKGVLDIGAGLFRQGEQTTAFRFDGAKTYISFDEDLDKLTFDEITLNTGAGQIVGEGHAYVSEADGGAPGGLIGQFRAREITVSPAGVFGRPVKFGSGVLDMRIGFNPLKIDIGQLLLQDDNSRYSLSGAAALTSKGWQTALDINVDRLSRDQVINLWPLAYKPKTRTWLDDNIKAGVASNIVVSIRANPGERPQLNLGFDANAMRMRYMRAMPVVEDASGYVVMTDSTLNSVLNAGRVVSPDGGVVDVAGTSIYIPDITIKEAPAEISLHTQSTVTSALALLDLPPFEFITKAGLEVDFAHGQVATSGKIGLPLAEKIVFDQVDFEIDGVVSDVTSDRLIAKKLLSADRLRVHLNSKEIEISGDATLGNTPVSGVWTQKFGPENIGRSRVEGNIELSQRFLDEFKIVLPEGSVAGRGRATMTVDLVKDQPPAFSLVSDLNQMTLKLQALDWSKPKNVTGRLAVSGRMGSPPHIDNISIETKGLSANGSITLTSDGGLDLARFERVSIGGWLDAPIDIRTPGPGQTSYTLVGGSVDMRRNSFSHAGGGGADGSSRIKLRLDRLQLSSGIVLNDLQGDINTAGGLNGSFTARVNGGARVVGSLAPLANGTGVRITSQDAGAVMRSAGVFTTAFGGVMDMVLFPTLQTGEYDGNLTITATRVRDAPALAELLSLISVVGLIEQLGGDGISFGAIDASFRLTPDAIRLKESSAVGASMGITMTGDYEFGSDKINMTGVLSPIYALNGLLEQTKIFGGLFGKQTGEGLFGFNYTLKGTKSAPVVGINPLSILTPGLFREIFRQPVPEKP